MAEVLRDFPPGPLDRYRNKASFDWKIMTLFLYGEKEVRQMELLYQELKKYPEFLPQSKPLSFEEERYLSFRQNAIIRANEEPFTNRFVHFAFSAFIKFGLSVRVFRGVMESMGSARHKPLIEQINKGKISGCFCLTEVGHGTNVKGMQMRATYDEKTKEFVMHSPNFEAAKCWAGGLGTTATHALVYAQLYTKGKHYGLHTFVVPIRDPDTLIPYPGIRVGDMGEKMGLNGIDNGFLMFDNYRIPREYLLNKTADLTEEGEYVTPIEDANKRFGATLVALSSTRVGVVIGAELGATNALTIAVRYTSVRKQFGPGDEEIPVIEYPTTQYRLLPHLAGLYVLKSFSHYLANVYTEYSEKSLSGTAEDIGNFLGIELHIITSAAKPLAGWMARDAIQSCREACAGHGYLKAAGLSNIRNDIDANLTYEGENWVLIQQTGNFLLKLWPNILEGVQATSPMHSVDFLNNAKNILKSSRFVATNTQELCRPERILDIYQWLTCYLLKGTYERQEKLLEKGFGKFDVKNNNQVFHAKKLGVAFCEHFFLLKYLDKINACAEPSLKSVMLTMFSLYGLYSLEKHLHVLYQGGFASGEHPVNLVQDGITELCQRLKDDAVSLVDAIAPPDFLLNSVLGASDGQVYQRLEESFLSSPYGAGRPTWWPEIVHWKKIAQSSKL